jgi:hypothetical protein
MALDSQLELDGNTGTSSGTNQMQRHTLIFLGFLAFPQLTTRIRVVPGASSIPCIHTEDCSRCGLCIRNFHIGRRVPLCMYSSNNWVAIMDMLFALGSSTV